MAGHRPSATAGKVPDAFIEALDGHLAGQLGLPAVAHVLRNALGRDLEAALAVQFFLEAGRAREQLPPDAVEALMAEVDAVVTEDVPTQWSDDSATGSAGPEDPGAVPVQPGTLLKDRFELLELLGGGAMGQVFRARDRRRAETGAGESQVAIKLVSSTMAGATRALEALRQEAAITQRLAHPAVVRIHDLDREGPYTFLVMEWLKGESLARLLDRRRSRAMPRLQALQIVEGISRALAHAHGQGFVHGDVKPGNLFVTEDSGPRLLDFGVARAVEAPGGAQSVRGLTPGYASCEVLEGQEADPRDDLYSLACVAYRMLAGRRPFGGRTALEAEQAGLAPAPIEALTPTQWRTLEKALAFRREQRQPDINSFLAQLKGPREEAAPAPPAAAPAPAAPGPGAVTGSGILADRRIWAAAAATVTLGIVILFRGGGSGTVAPDAPGDGALAGQPPAGGVIQAVAREPAGPVPQALSPGEPGNPAPTETPGTGAAPQSDTDAGPGSRPDAGTTTARQNATPAGDTAGGRPEAAPRPAPAPRPGNEGREPRPAATLAAASPAAVLAADRSTPGRGATGTGPDLPAPSSPEPTGGQSPAAAAGDAEPAASGAVPDTGEVGLARLQLKRYVEADYPRSAAIRRISGWVDVGFAVDAKGRPTDLKILGAEPAELFDEAALGAVRRWRFAEPGDNGLKPGTRSRVRVRFQPE